MSEHNLAAKFLSEFEGKITTLNDSVRALESREEFVNSVLAIKPTLTKGRSFHTIVMEDLLQAYMDITWSITKLDDIPIAPYRHILEKIDPEPVSDKSAYQHLRKARNVGLRNVMNGYLPEFITMFGQTHTPEVKDILDDWLDTVDAMSDVLLSNDAINMLSRADRLSRRVSKIYKTNYEKDPESGQSKEKKDGVKGDYKNDDLNRLLAKAEASRLPEHVIKKLQDDFEVMDEMTSNSAEYASMMKSVRLVMALPWDRRSVINTDINKVQAALDSDHFGLDDIKSQVVEHLAVQKRTGKPTGKIVCLDGAPGIGKTSLGESIARATGREFVRISLGGISDEHEIRGHRPTYIGSIPGRIIEALKKANKKNPLILLDEIDKIEANSSRGKAVESALLEVLDPEQNKTFRDSFLSMEFDLSEVMFICTSNNFREISAPLRDRMEIVRLPAYTTSEKLEIATRYVLPKQLSKAGLAADSCTITPETVKALVSTYALEPGVRKLEQYIEKICRKVAYKLETEPENSITITPEQLPELLGETPAQEKRLLQNDDVGIVNGLSVSGGYYGDVMPFEVLACPAKQFAVKATGQMGKSMSESVEKVSSWLKAHAAEYGVSNEELNKIQLHVDAPDDGGKDGPSAGAAMLTACLSALIKKPVRADLAMTGKLSLRGHVLAIGGVREKLEGALNNDIKTVLIPEANVPDLAKVSDEIKQGLQIIPVSHIDQVLKHALGPNLLKAAFDNKDAEKVDSSPDGQKSLEAPRQYPALPAPSGTAPA